MRGSPYDGGQLGAYLWGAYLHAAEDPSFANELSGYGAPAFGLAQVGQLACAQRPSGLQEGEELPLGGSSLLGDPFY